MNKIYFSSMLCLSLLSCSQESKTDKNLVIEKKSSTTETKIEEKKDEKPQIVSSLNIKDINAFFASNEKKKVKDNTIFWCYDIEELAKIEFIGSAENITIYFNDEVVVENVSFESKYNLSTDKIGTGGVIELRGNGKVLQSIKIEYEGCL